MHKPSTLARARALTARALALGLVALAPLGAAQAADAWPSQPLKALVPFGPGSSPDQVARIVGEKAGAILGQTVVVENKPAPAATSAPSPSPTPSPTATPSASRSPARW